jgi:multisubunit Na+/H+ antiporter MnhG subunit
MDRAQEEGHVGTDNPDGGSPAAEEGAEAVRLARLTVGLQQAQVDRAAWFRERVLAILAGVLVPLGVILVLIGWHGASRTSNVYEQVPYLISGGELGQTLALVGALCYFAHWLTALVKEHRAQGAAIVAAITHLEYTLAQAMGTAAPGAVTAAVGPALVATARGSLAHRPDCSVVAGKSGLRAVTERDGLARCRICLP